MFGIAYNKGGHFFKGFCKWEQDRGGGYIEYAVDCRNSDRRDGVVEKIKFENEIKTGEEYQENYCSDKVEKNVDYRYPFCVFVYTYT